MKTNFMVRKTVALALVIASSGIAGWELSYAWENDDLNWGPLRSVGWLALVLATLAVLVWVLRSHENENKLHRAGKIVLVFGLGIGSALGAKDVISSISLKDLVLFGAAAAGFAIAWIFTIKEFKMPKWFINKATTSPAPPENAPEPTTVLPVATQSLPRSTNRPARPTPEGV